MLGVAQTGCSFFYIWALNHNATGIIEILGVMARLTIDCPPASLSTASLLMIQITSTCHWEGSNIPIDAYIYKYKPPY